MKKLNKLVLNKSKIMSPQQMKHIKGGYWICCRGTNDYDDDGIIDPGCPNGSFFADSCSGHGEACG